MKKILIATTALVATAGFAQAEGNVTVSGSAIAGLQYNSEGDQKVKLLSKANVAFDASGETDGGLTFGFNTNHIVENNGTLDNDDTTVYISGAFGKLSFGAVAEADEVAGLSDIGWDGLDVDDVAEAFVGDELGDIIGVDLSHNVNYTYSTGPISVSLSGKLKTSHAVDTDSATKFGTYYTDSVPFDTKLAASDVNSYAIGAKYTFGNAYVGLGYAKHSMEAGLVGIEGDGYLDEGEFDSYGKLKADVVSLYGGATFDAIKVSALYSEVTAKSAIGKIKGKAYGVNASYSMDALTLSMGMSKATADDDAFLNQKAIGIGASYNLGGGASISGGIAQVESVGDENQGTIAGKKAKETRADFGVKFTF